MYNYKLNFYVIDINVFHNNLRKKIIFGLDCMYIIIVIPISNKIIEEHNIYILCIRVFFSLELLFFFQIFHNRNIPNHINNMEEKN